MRVNFHTEHDHETIENKNENEDKIGNISESLPDGENRKKILKSVTSALSISWFDETVLFDVLADVSQVASQGNGGGLISKANGFTQLTNDAISNKRLGGDLGNSPAAFFVKSD